MEINALFYLVLAICIGFFANKLKLIPDSATEALPALLINICYPAMILSSFDSLSIQELVSSGLFITIATLAITLILFFLGGFLFRNLERPKKILFNYILGIGNVTYVGIPLISVFFGAKGVSFAILHGVVQDVLIWILYYPTFLKKSEKLRLRPLQNPCLIAVFIGLILVFTGLPLPGFLTLTLEHLSSISSPVALLFLGITIAKYGPFGWTKSVSAIAASLMKVILLPALLFPILFFMTDLNSAILLSILFGCPAPIMSIIWAKQYDGDVELSVNCCICSTLIYLVVVSLILTLVAGMGWI